MQTLGTVEHQSVLSAMLNANCVPDYEPNFDFFLTILDGVVQYVCTYIYYYLLA